MNLCSEKVDSGPKVLQRTHFCNKICCFSLLGISLSLSLLSYLSFLHTFSSVVFIFMFLDCLCCWLKTLKRVPFLTCGIKKLLSLIGIYFFVPIIWKKKESNKWCFWCFSINRSRGFFFLFFNILIYLKF
jgi:hypothetical protein